MVNSPQPYFEFPPQGDVGLFATPPPPPPPPTKNQGKNIDYEYQIDMNQLSKLAYLEEVSRMHSNSMTQSEITSISR